MYVVFTMFCVLPVLVGVQVIGIHMRDGSELRATGKLQALAYETIPGVRGTIYDAGGRTLAVNTARHDLAVDPTWGDFDEHAEEFYARLANVTGRTASYYRSRVNARPNGSKYVSLGRKLEETQRAVVESWDYPFVIIETTFDRLYNYETTLAHVLGHVNSDGTGAAGLELRYDNFLQGTDGRRERRRNLRGTTSALVGGGDTAPHHGESLVLTIDLVQQSILEESLAAGVAESGAKWATAVALDPNSGAVLAMASVPTYDPNRPAAYPVASLRNRAVTDQFEPGSTFKLVSTVAAVETNVAKLTDEVDTGQGYAVFSGRAMRDTHANGIISLAEAISVSSNIAVATIAQRVEARKLYEYARNLGFGQPTWIDLPGEVSGLLKKPSTWSGTTKTSMSIGYEVSVTPIQLVNAYAAFANGGRLMQPYVVAERRDILGQTTWRADTDSVRIAFKRKTADKLLGAFESVVNEGTATSAKVNGLRIAGKTGTSLKVVEGRYVSGRSRASFVGFFPADDPQVVLAIVIDEPKTSIYGSEVAAPVFRHIVEGWLPSLSNVHTRPQIAEADAIPLEEFPAPEVGGRPLAVVRGLLHSAGFVVDVPSRAPDDVFVADVELRRKTRVQLASVELSSETASAEVMPDLRGLGARQAVYWLQAKDIKVKVEGHGRVVSQIPAAGRSLSGEATLVCR